MSAPWGTHRPLGSGSCTTCCGAAPPPVKAAASGRPTSYCTYRCWQMQPAVHRRTPPRPPASKTRPGNQGRAEQAGATNSPPPTQWDTPIRPPPAPHREGGGAGTRRAASETRPAQQTHANATPQRLGHSMPRSAFPARSPPPGEARTTDQRRRLAPARVDFSIEKGLTERWRSPLRHTLLIRPCGSDFVRSPI